MELKKEIVVFDTDEVQCRAMSDLLRAQGYRVSCIHSLLSLDRYLSKANCLVVVVDLNTTGIDNRTIRELKFKNTGVYFLGLSKHRVNPELKESICYHMYACLRKPVDLDELLYCLKSIYDEDEIP